eukprot:scaffold4232_cov107-Isochrysis_galbana.AAC.4
MHRSDICCFGRNGCAPVLICSCIRDVPHERLRRARVALQLQELVDNEQHFAPDRHRTGKVESVGCRGHVLGVCSYRSKRNSNLGISGWRIIDAALLPPHASAASRAPENSTSRPLSVCLLLALGDPRLASVPHRAFVGTRGSF